MLFQLFAFRVKANERTFLAWFRTGLSLVGAGFALTKFMPTCTYQIASHASRGPAGSLAFDIVYTKPLEGTMALTKQNTHVVVQQVSSAETSTAGGGDFLPKMCTCGLCCIWSCFGTST